MSSMPRKPRATPAANRVNVLSSILDCHLTLFAPIRQILYNPVKAKLSLTNTQCDYRLLALACGIGYSSSASFSLR
jgi:hypothetical protein